MLSHPYVLGILTEGFWETKDFTRRFVSNGIQVIFLDTITVVSWRFGIRERLIS
jgi:hypothetical protein